MKILKSLFILIILFLGLLSTNLFAQEAETHHITLHVDTSAINSQNQSQVSNFGQDDGSSNEDYTIEVNVGDTIIWEGISSSSNNDTVNISAINYKGQPNIFGQNHLDGDGQNPEQVQAAVVTGYIGVVVKYTISFKVINNGIQHGGTYHIDPKIIIKG